MDLVRLAIIRRIYRLLTEKERGEEYMNSINDIWASIMEVLSQRLTATAINTWFTDCSPLELRESTLVLVCSGSDYKRNTVQDRFGGIIKEVLKELFSCDFELEVLLPEEVEDYTSGSDSKNTPIWMEGYTFENFVVGKSNEYAYAAAQGVVKNPGNRTYNPLLIYGNSGLGKTHLLQAIGSAVQESKPESKIAYLKGEEFTNQMVRAIKEGNAEEFRQKYRNVDLFLIDDIQFIAGKEATQEEFFHTFNNIYEAGNQIVMTSDRPPIDMLLLDDRLRTRFEGGLMADVKPPDVETRMAIIRDKAGHLGMRLSDEIVQYIAEKITSNIRQIEGVIKRLSAFRDLENNEINVSTVNRAIGDVVRSGIYVPTTDDIIGETARFYQTTPEDIKGPSRVKNIANARHVTAYMIRNLTNLSLPAIGEFLNRDHATVLASIRKIEKEISTDKEVSATIRDITSNINSRQR